MLTFITLSATQTRTLPKVSYIKASEIWSIACTLFIFASLVEFAFVNLLWRRKKHLEIGNVRKLNFQKFSNNFLFASQTSTSNILKKTLTPSMRRKSYQPPSPSLHKSHSDTSLNENHKPLPPPPHATRKFEAKLSVDSASVGVLFI